MPKELKLDPSKIFLKGIISFNLEQIQEFKCGNGSMESFLKIEAYPSHIMREASTTLAFYGDKLAAYYTLHRSPINIEHGLENTTKDALALARLAVATEFQGLGLGTYIINKIKEIAYMTNEKYIKTDAVFERWKWYKERGFIPVIEDETDPEKTPGFVYMIIDLFDDKLVEEYCDV